MPILDYIVTAQTDDCLITGTTINTANIRISAGLETNWLFVYRSGMRFQNVAVPQGATITVAYITYTAALLGVKAVILKIYGEDADDTSTFSDLADYEGRTRTSAGVTGWSPGDWSVDSEYNSPSITTIIQEIVDRAGWVSGNAMTFFWEDNGTTSGNRNAYGYKGSTTKCAKLHIEYTVPTNNVVMNTVIIKKKRV
jgi:hypothetical protein